MSFCRDGEFMARTLAKPMGALFDRKGRPVHPRTILGGYGMSDETEIFEDLSQMHIVIRTRTPLLGRIKMEIERLFLTEFGKRVKVIAPPLPRKPLSKAFKKAYTASGMI